MMKKVVIPVLVMMAFATMAWAQTQHEFDKDGFDKLAKQTVGQVIGGDFDVKLLIKDMESLVDKGIDGCTKHMNEAEIPGSEKQVMKAVIDHAHAMSKLSLAEVEAQWHEGGYLKSINIDLDSFDHFGETMCYFDTIVHPATVIICLNEFKKTGDEELLEQIKDELVEVREHLKHLE